MRIRQFQASIIAVLLLACFSESPAQLKGFAFLRSSVGARSASLGGAYTAIPNDLHDIAANPAGLAMMNEKQGVFDYVNSLLDIQSGFGAYLHPLTKGNLAFSIFYNDYGKLDRIDGDGIELGTFSANSFVLTAAYARPYTANLWFGGAIKYFRSSIDNYNADGLALDAGVFFDTHLFDNLKVGAGVYNLGKARTAFIETKEDLPLRFEVGFSKQLAHLPLLWSVSVLKYTDDDVRFAFGGEFTLNENLFLRLGYNSLGSAQKVNSTDDKFAGASVGFGFSHKAYAFDYAYSSFGVVGGLSRFSFSMRF